MPGVRIKSFTTSYPGLTTVLFNEVLVSEAFTPPAEIVNPQEYKAKKYKAIWDTGATGTVITQKVIDDCDLKPIGVVNVKTTKGLFKTNSYLVNVWLPNRVIVDNVQGCLGEIGDADVLIGMNIISQGDFAITNKDGKTVFSFRLPSVEHIDFVEKPFKPKPAKTIPSRKRFRH
jgi:predicted aspartyl protease